MEIYWTGEAIATTRKFCQLLIQARRLYFTLINLPEATGFSFFSSFERKFVTMYYKVHPNPFDVVFGNKVISCFEAVCKDIILKKIRDPGNVVEGELCHHLSSLTNISYKGIMAVLSVVKYMQENRTSREIYFTQEAEYISSQDLQHISMNKFAKYFECRKMLFPRMTLAMLKHLAKKFPDGDIDLKNWPKITNYEQGERLLLDPLFRLLTK